jgi:hypothetical protein
MDKSYCRGSNRVFMKYILFILISTFSVFSGFCEASMPPACDSEETEKVLRFLTRKYIDPFLVGRNRHFSGTQTLSANKETEEYQCRTRYMYSIDMSSKSHVIIYTIYWSDPAKKQFSVELNSISNNN